MIGAEASSVALCCWVSVLARAWTLVSSDAAMLDSVF
jgi:hypothetical protein